MATWFVLAALLVGVVLLSRSAERAIAAERKVTRSVLHGDRSVHRPEAHDGERCSSGCDRPSLGASLLGSKSSRMGASFSSAKNDSALRDRHRGSDEKGRNGGKACRQQPAE